MVFNEKREGAPEESDSRRPPFWNPTIVKNEDGEILTPEPPDEKAEIIEPAKEEFAGQDKEVTVKRTDGNFESGWEVKLISGDKVTVVNRELRKKKIVGKKELELWQDFKKDDEVPVLVRGKIDENKWRVIEDLGYGAYGVARVIDGKVTAPRTIWKTDLISAKLAELDVKRRGITELRDSGSAADEEILKKIDKEASYWRKKWEVSEILGKEHAESLKK